MKKLLISAMIVAGAAFGTNECIRISYATSTKNIIEATQRIKKSLEKLR